MRKIYELERTINQMTDEQKQAMFCNIADKLNYNVFDEHYRPHGRHHSTYARNIGRYGEQSPPKIEFVNEELPKMLQHILELIEVFETAIDEVSIHDNASVGGDLLFE